jgi:hypothetical protein
MPRLIGAGSVVSRSAVLSFLLCIAFAGSALGTTTGSHPPSSMQFTPKRAPEAHLYWHFLLYQNYLDRQAVIREQQGKDGQTLRSHFQQRLHFTDAQFGIVRQAGLKLEADLKAVEAKVMPIVEQDRQWIKVHGRTDGPPPGHPLVQELQKEHEAIVAGAMEQLNKSLGAENAAKFQTFIDTEWAPHVTVHTVHARPHDPKNNRVVPRHMEARQ